MLIYWQSPLVGQLYCLIRTRCPVGDQYYCYLLFSVSLSPLISYHRWTVSSVTKNDFNAPKTCYRIVKQINTQPINLEFKTKCQYLNKEGTLKYRKPCLRCSPVHFDFIFYYHARTRRAKRQQVYPLK